MWTCRLISKYFDICWYTSTYVNLNWNILTYFHICWILPINIEICQHILSYFDIFRHMPTHVKILRHRFTHVDLFGSFGKLWPSHQMLLLRQGAREKEKTKNCLEVTSSLLGFKHAYVRAPKKSTENLCSEFVNDIYTVFDPSSMSSQLFLNMAFPLSCCCAKR